jgi:hypothetical protein
MEDTITFWLDNKISSGLIMAEVGNQILVLYRDKYYVVVGGAALMKGVRPLHYSKTSMPTVWKNALKGILPQIKPAIDSAEDENMPVTISTKKERIDMQKSFTPVSDLPESQLKPTPKKTTTPDAKPVKIAQTVVSALCPYCNHKQDLPFEKGKNGKPFFAACVRCSSEFAVRFVPVTMYQAQVAAFK